jgi:uncharacterized protein
VAQKFVGAAVAAALALLSAPAGAQGFSDSYSFLKAVRDGDGNKVTNLVSVPGSVVINTRDRSTGEGALHIVTRDRNLGWLSFLLGKGARKDIQDNQGMTPLALAAHLGWVEGAQLLLGQRASVDLPNVRGETPLILAVHNRDLNMVRLLLTAGADPKKTDRAAGYSALDYAKQDSRAPAILKLLETATAKPASQGPKL